ncbi:MAG: hypothetical protein ACOCP8_07700 [archaeon]
MGKNIKIGDNNKIENNNFGDEININKDNQNKGFFKRHPVLMTFIISFITGFILLFNFWEEVISYLEKLFN